MKYEAKELAMLECEISCLEENLEMAKLAKNAVERKQKVFMCIDGRKQIDVSEEAFNSDTYLYLQIKEFKKYFGRLEGISFIAEDEIKLPRIIESDSLRDPRDGRIYKTVKIGKQVWMAGNLNFESENSKCYKNDPANAEIYGRLYTWDEALTVAPPGWHLPTDAEWTALTDAIGGEANAGTLLKSASGWDSNGNGTDDYGFTALPAGSRNTHSTFYNVGSLGYWWSATQSDSPTAYYRYMHYNNSAVGRNSRNKALSFSVRCVQETVI